MDCRLEWALRALYTALQWPPAQAPRGARPGKGPRERPHSAGADGPLPGRRQIPQRFDERPVGFEQILTPKTRGRHPLEPLAIERARWPGAQVGDARESWA